MAAEKNIGVENATIAELQQALAKGRTSASALTRAYLAHRGYDLPGRFFNAVREVSPEVLATPPPRPRRRAQAAARRHPDPSSGTTSPPATGSTPPPAIRWPSPGARRSATQRSSRGWRRRRGDPRQGQSDRIRQHPRDRHAVWLQLLGGRSAAPMPQRSTTRACRLSRRVGRARARPSRWRPGCAPPRSAPRPRARCCRRRRRTVS